MTVLGDLNFLFNKLRLRLLLFFSSFILSLYTVFLHNFSSYFFFSLFFAQSFSSFPLLSRVFHVHYSIACICIHWHTTTVYLDDSQLTFRFSLKIVSSAFLFGIMFTMCILWIKLNCCSMWFCLEKRQENSEKKKIVSEENYLAVIDNLLCISTAKLVYMFSCCNSITILNFPENKWHYFIIEQERNVDLSV